MAKNKIPQWITKYRVSVEQAEYEGNQITYHVLKKKIAPGLLGFIGRSKEGYFYISEEVPEEFRVPQIIHEYIEFVELKDQKDRCLKALKRELELIPEEKRDAYLAYRKDFFERLVAYHEDSDDEAFKRRITQSRDFLRKIT